MSFLHRFFGGAGDPVEATAADGTTPSMPAAGGRQPSEGESVHGWCRSRGSNPDPVAWNGV